VILALNNERQTAGDKASAELAKAGDLINLQYANGLNTGPSSQGFWFDWIIARLLQNEASAEIR
jgi:hypothetical protein